MFIFIIFIFIFSLYCNAFVYDFSRASYDKNYLITYPKNVYHHQYYLPSIFMHPSDDMISKIKSIHLQKRQYHENFTENLRNQIFSEIKNIEMHHNLNYLNPPFNYGYPRKNEFSYPSRFEQFSLNRYTRDNSRKDSSLNNKYLKYSNNMDQRFNYQNNLETHYYYKRLGDKQFESRENSQTREWSKNSENNIKPNEDEDHKKAYRSKREHRKLITDGSSNFYSDSYNNNNNNNKIRSYPIRSQIHYREYRIQKSWNHNLNDPLSFVIESYPF